MDENVLKDLEKLKMAMGQQVNPAQLPPKINKFIESKPSILNYQPPPKFCKNMPDDIDKPIVLGKVDLSGEKAVASQENGQ